MKKFIILQFLISSCFFVSAQEVRQLYSIAFYNLENLFDTEDDSATLDDDFTPKGTYAWTQKRYESKLSNMAFVISRLAKEYIAQGPAIIGVSEVENRKVLEELDELPRHKRTGYQ